MESASPSPSEEAAGNQKRARFFDEKMRNLCWQKADVVAGRHPERWRKDGAGNIVCRRFWHCEGCLCYEYDHIIPFSKGGGTTVENCQILQSRVNRSKGSKDQLERTVLEQYSCDLKFTGGPWTLARNKRGSIAMVEMGKQACQFQDNLWQREKIKSWMLLRWLSMEM